MRKRCVKRPALWQALERHRVARHPTCTACLGGVTNWQGGLQGPSPTPLAAATTNV